MEDNTIDSFEPYGLLLWVCFSIYVFFNFYFTIIGAAISLVIFFVCKPFFEKWAKELGHDPKIPFILVMLIGIFGQLAYYIYYLIMKPTITPEKDEDSHTDKLGDDAK